MKINRKKKKTFTAKSFTKGNENTGPLTRKDDFRPKKSTFFNVENLSVCTTFKVSIRKYKTEQQVECKTNYKTECNIEKKIQPITIKVRLCRSVASKDCGTGEDTIETNGEIVCTTIYESGIIKNTYLKKKTKGSV